MMKIPTNVTKEDLFDAIARIGVLQAAQYGYFNALVATPSVPEEKPSVVKNVVYATPPAGGVSMPPYYGYTTIDLTPYNLSEPPVLNAVILNPISKVKSYAISFQDVTKTSATVLCRYDVVTGYDNLPSFNQDIRVFIG